MPNREELLNRLATEIGRAPNELLWTPKIDLEYAYGQLTLSKETRKHCNSAIIGGKMNGYYRFKKKDFTVHQIYTRYSDKNRQSIELLSTRVARRYDNSNTGDKNKQREKLFKI